MARFVLETIVGPFRDFLHEHRFEEHAVGTLTRDTVTFHSPFGPLGRIVDVVVMRAYMRRLIAERNEIIAAELEDRGRTLSS